VNAAIDQSKKCNMKFTEAQLEAAIIQLLDEVGYPHVMGAAINRQPDEVLIKEDLRAFLAARYAADNITAGEIESVIRKLTAYSSADRPRRGLQRHLRASREFREVPEVTRRNDMRRLQTEGGRSSILAKAVKVDSLWSTQ
jgi:hypothetical protein